MSKSLSSIQRYRSTPKGVLTNLYHKMKGRRGVEFSLSEFHLRFLSDKKFTRLHLEWVDSGMLKEKKPSIDRISNKLGYTNNNIHMITWGENRHKQTMERRSRKGAVIQYLNGVEVGRFKSQRIAAMKTGISQSNMSSVLNKKRPHCEGYVFTYESKVIGNIHEQGE